jgi:CxxC motif-containing protein (DUF1111 family)
VVLTADREKLKVGLEALVDQLVVAGLVGTAISPNELSPIESPCSILEVRIPTPVFGLGLVENTPDDTLRANLAATRDARYHLGIGGSFNTNGNDGTITRFGWKAQNKSLLIFAGEAYNVEQGVTNEAFPDERAGVAGCVFNPLPEDASGINNEGGESPHWQ